MVRCVCYRVPPGSEGREAVGHDLLHLLAGGGQGADQLPYDLQDLRKDQCSQQGKD